MTVRVFNQNGTLTGLSWAFPGSIVAHRVSGEVGRVVVTQEHLDHHQRVVGVVWASGNQETVRVSHLRKSRPREKDSLRQAERVRHPTTGQRHHASKKGNLR